MLKMAELPNPLKVTYLACQTPARFQSLFSEMLNIFMVSHIKTASAKAVFTQTTALQPCYFKQLLRQKKKNLMQKVF